MHFAFARHHLRGGYVTDNNRHLILLKTVSAHMISRNYGDNVYQSHYIRCRTMRPMIRATRAIFRERINARTLSQNKYYRYVMSVPIVMRLLLCDH